MLNTKSVNDSLSHYCPLTHSFSYIIKPLYWSASLSTSAGHHYCALTLYNHSNSY